MKNMSQSTSFEESSAFEIMSTLERNIKKVKQRAGFPIIRSELTARSRNKPSVPVRLSTKKFDPRGLIGLDFGCGKSIDSEFLESLGATCYRYDPFHAPMERSEFNRVQKFDFILAGYVLNVVSPIERYLIAKTIGKLIEPTKGIIILGLRDDLDAVKQNWRKCFDGYITKKQTFQHFYPNTAESYREIDTLFPSLKWRRIGRGTWMRIGVPLF